MRLMVTGSRSFIVNGQITPWGALVHEEFVRVLDNLNIGGTEVLIHGDAQGPDRWAKAWAHAAGIPEDKHNVCSKPGETFGQAAYRRNLEMLDARPDLLVACWDLESKGTMHTVNGAVDRGIPFIFVATHLIPRN